MAWPPADHLSEPEANGHVVKHPKGAPGVETVIERRIERGRQRQHANNPNERRHSAIMAQNS